MDRRRSGSHLSAHVNSVKAGLVTCLSHLSPAFERSGSCNSVFALTHFWLYQVFRFSVSYFDFGCMQPHCSADQLRSDLALDFLDTLLSRIPPSVVPVLIVTSVLDTYTRRALSWRYCGISKIEVLRLSRSATWWQSDPNILAISNCESWTNRPQVWTGKHCQAYTFVSSVSKGIKTSSLCMSEIKSQCTHLSHQRLRTRIFWEILR